MELKITPRQALSLTLWSKKILARMDAGLYYRWDLGYNTLLRQEDLDAAMKARKN